MRIAFALAAALLASPASALAVETPPAATPPAVAAPDANNPGLDALFASLKETDDYSEARKIEAKIWALWMDAGDQQVNRLMDYTIAAMDARAYSLAISYLDAMIAMKPEFAEGWNKRATVYWMMGDYGHSLSDIQRTLALEPRHWGALSGLGMIMRDLGELEKAVTAFRLALEIDPNLEDVKVGLQLLEDKLGKGI